MESGAQCQNQRPWAENNMWEVPFKHQQTLCTVRGDWDLAHAAQRSGTVSILGDIQKPSEPGPGQQVLGGPNWAGGLDQMDSRSFFPTSTSQ